MSAAWAWTAPKSSAAVALARAIFRIIQFPRSRMARCLACLLLRFFPPVRYDLGATPWPKTARETVFSVRKPAPRDALAADLLLAARRVGLPALAASPWRPGRAR